MSFVFGRPRHREPHQRHLRDLRRGLLPLHVLERQLGGGRADPDSYTHGTSAERRTWFTTGYESGDPDRCDTFAAGAL